MDKATLSDLPPAALREWLALPPGRLLLEHLQDEEAKALDFIAAETRANRHHDAALAAGGLEAVRSLWEALHPPDPPAPEPEEPWVDPATIVRPET